MPKKKFKVIAEIGCNHKGSLKLAKKMILIAKLSGADVAKFQKRTPKELLSQKEYNSPHPNPSNSYGATYGEHREYLEFTPQQHQQLIDYCHLVGIEYSTSVWDLTSAKQIIELNPPSIKIPSACNLKFDLLSYLYTSFPGEIHISLGMTTFQEIDSLMQFVFRTGRSQDTVIYHCTSGYPIKFKDANLLEIKRLKKSYGRRLKGIGFSGHHLGIAIDNAALVLGATYIERHFTLDRTWKGTDHAASLEPQGLKRLTRDLLATSQALSYKKTDLLGVEQAQRLKLKRY